MSMQDLMSDFVARINNSTKAKKTHARVIKNNLVIDTCKKMTKLGYFKGFEIAENNRELVVELDLNRITKLTRISKPGLRKYCGYTNIPRISNGVGMNILTTPKGVLANHEAKKEKVGGEVLFQVI